MSALMSALSLRASAHSVTNDKGHGWHHWDIEQGEHYTNTMFLDIYDAIVERYAAADVALPNLTHAVGAWSPAVTNYVVITLTNRACFFPFTHEGLVNIPPAINPNWLDDRIEVIVPYYLQWWKGDTNDQTFTTYLNTLDGSGSNYPNAFPVCNMAAVMDFAGVGYVTNRTTNVWDVVTGGDTYWLHTPSSTGNYTMVEGHMTTNSWVQYPGETFPYRQGTRDIRYFGTNKSTAYFNTNNMTTNPSVGYSGQNTFNLSGSVYIVTNQTLEEKTWSINMGHSGPVLDLTLDDLWYSVSVAEFEDDANFGTVFSIKYDQELTLYSSASPLQHAPPPSPNTWPFTTLYEIYKERYLVLDALRWTAAIGGSGQTNFHRQQEEGYYAFGTSTNETPSGILAPGASCAEALAAGGSRWGLDFYWAEAGPVAISNFYDAAVSYQAFCFLLYCTHDTYPAEPRHWIFDAQTSARTPGARWPMPNLSQTNDESEIGFYGQAESEAALDVYVPFYDKWSHLDTNNLLQTFDDIQSIGATEREHMLVAQDLIITDTNPVFGNPLVTTAQLLSFPGTDVCLNWFTDQESDTFFDDVYCNYHGTTTLNVAAISIASGNAKSVARWDHSTNGFQMINN